MWSIARSLWAEPAIADRPPRGRLDRWSAGAVVAVALIEAVTRSDLASRPAALLVGLAVAAALLVRRERPLAAVALGFGTITLVDVVMAFAGEEPLILVSAAPVLVLAYALFRWGAGREAAVGLAIMSTTFTVSVVTDFTGPVDAIGGAAVLLLAAALGGAIRYRTAARDQLVQRARLEEREQLARELHDTVAHHVSAIAIQAQAGLTLARSSSLPGAVEALEVIEHESARTLADMRAMVGALRDREAQPPVTPQRGIADLRALASNGAASPRVEVTLAGDLGELAPAVESALYRVAQESVTNAQRHARDATRVEVCVTGTAAGVHMTVTDDGVRAAATQATSGFGIVGMTERVTLLGGTLTAGPRADRGWTVTAILPRQGRAP